MARSKTTSRASRPDASALVPERTCFECGGGMERGFVADMGYGSITQALWVEGEPERGRFSGSIKLRKKRAFYVETFRCDGCGAVRSYATVPK